MPGYNQKRPPQKGGRLRFIFFCNAFVIGRPWWMAFFVFRIPNVRPCQGNLDRIKYWKEKDDRPEGCGV